MIHLLEHAPAAQSVVPLSRLPMMLDAYRQDWLTGVVRIAWGADAAALFLFAEGALTSAYLLIGETPAEIPLPDLQARISAETISASAVSLPRESIHLIRSVLEWYPPTETATVETSALERQIGTWSTQTTAGVIHLEWPDAEGFVLLPGNAPSDMALFMTEKRIERGAAGLAAIYAHSEALCTLALYVPPAKVLALQGELDALRKTFTTLVNTVMRRYTELVGGHVARTLMLDLSARAQVGGWNIRLANTGVTEAQAFKEPDEAARAYRSLLNDLIEDMAVVIGKRLAGMLVLETSIQLDSAAQKMIQAYSLVPTTTIRRDLYGRNI